MFKNPYNLEHLELELLAFSGLYQDFLAGRDTLEKIEPFNFKVQILLLPWLPVMSSIEMSLGQFWEFLHQSYDEKLWDGTRNKKKTSFYIGLLGGLLGPSPKF